MADEFAIESSADVQTLKKLLDATEERVRRLQDLLDCVPGSVWEVWFDPSQQHRSFVSEHIVELSGYSVDDWRQPNFWRECVHPEDGSRMMEEVDAIMARGRGSVEYRIVRKNGTPLWVLNTMSVIRSATGDVVGLRGVVVDVDVHKQAQAKLDEVVHREKRLVARFESFIANIPGVVWEIWFERDPSEQRVDFISDRIEQLTGYSREEWFEKNLWFDVTHADDRERSRRESDAIIASESGNGSVEYRWIRKDGSVFWALTRMNVVRNESGAPIGLRGVTMDVTDKRVAQIEREQVRIQEEILRAETRALADLSTPLIPISDDVVIMPLVGDIDESRAERALQLLMQGMTREHAKVAILDITGVPAMNPQIAEALLRAARAVQLLGARVVLSGVRADVARTLTQMGIDLGGIVTRSSLKSGIAYATGRK